MSSLVARVINQYENTHGIPFQSSVVPSHYASPRYIKGKFTLVASCIIDINCIPISE